MQFMADGGSSGSSDSHGGDCEGGSNPTSAAAADGCGATAAASPSRIASAASPASTAPAVALSATCGSTLTSAKTGAAARLPSLAWADERMRAQVAAMEEQDEDLFVALGADGRISDGLLDYGATDFGFASFKMPALERLLAEPASRRALRRDCQLCCFPFTDKAYWLPANLAPRCSLEALARSIFEEHVQHTRGIDRSRSGVEWWAQIRQKGAESESIGFHFVCRQCLSLRGRLSA